MKEKWLTRFESMRREIEKCSHSAVGDPDTMASIECCFNIALKYWSEIQMGIEAVQFDSSLDEIDYYKTVKPLFRSQIEYYNLLYQAELLRPKERSDIKEFWLKEQQRLDKFIRENHEFYNYYKSGATHLDEDYFLAAGFTDNRGNALYYDNLIALILALERYMTYIEGELIR
jgi:RteC protein